MDKELRFCFHMTEQNLITALPTPQMCFHRTDLWGLLVQDSQDNLRDESTEHSQYWATSTRIEHTINRKKLAFWVVLIWQKGEHCMPTKQRPVSVISWQGAKAWCLTQHPLKMILKAVKATWGAYPMHLSPVGLDLLLRP